MVEICEEDTRQCYGWVKVEGRRENEKDNEAMYEKSRTKTDG